ncbi:MAG: FecR domain-containing protein [Opitutaceae bacterium]
MKTTPGGSWLAAAVVVMVAVPVSICGAEAVLTRPGQLTVTAVTGELTIRAGDVVRPAKAEDRVRVDSRLSSGRRSLATLTFSNGATLELGPDSEVEVEELLQAPFSTALKPTEWKAEPSVSRTRLRLIRGEARVAVKRLLAARGSVFAVVTPAGVATIDEGALRVQARMTEIGLGLCVVELTQGVGAFEPEGGAARTLAAGKRTQWSVENDAATKRTRVTELK